MAALEAEASRQARAAFETRPHDIACFVVYPIQGEAATAISARSFRRGLRESCATSLMHC